MTETEKMTGEVDAAPILIPVAPVHGTHSRPRPQVRAIFEAVRFFWDLFEEGSDGDTRAMHCIMPLCGGRNLRKQVLHDFFQNKGFSLREAAVGLSDWLAGHHGMPPLSEDEQAELLDLCASAERPFSAVDDHELKVQRAFVRFVRYLEQTRLANRGADSRAIEYFIAPAFVPKGYGRRPGNYPEHVVPCALLRDRCLERLSDGVPIEQVATEIRPYLAIVMITAEQAAHLDRGRSSGGLGLKDKMPEGWTFESENIFERLKSANIAFDPPSPLTTNCGR